MQETPSETPQLPQRTESQSGHGWFLAPFFQWLFGGIDYPEEASRRLQDDSQNATIVYAASTTSSWLVLYINHVLPQLGLPLAELVVGLRSALHKFARKLWHQARKGPKRPESDWANRYDQSHQFSDEEISLANAVANQKTTFVTLRDRHGVNKRRGQDNTLFVRSLISVQRTTERPIIVYPHVLTDRALGGNESVLTTRIFGARRRPGALRALFLRVATSSTSTVRVADPINLKEFIETNSDLDDLAASRKLSHEITTRLAQEERVVAGPEHPSEEVLQKHILRRLEKDSSVIEWLKESGKSPSHFERKARKYIVEIAAKYDVNMLRFVDVCVGLIFNRIYDGIVIDQRGLQRVAEASRKGPVVFVPCHRSHIDYLALSHTLWRYSLVPPHIAAGINLSFFPMGYIFRRSGAFFMRRTFRGNPLYAAVFRHYIFELLKMGVNTEFFIEGGRTRTGKLLMPKYGMLKMIVEAWQQGACDDVQFIPVSIDYERIIEASSYQRELAGAEKKKEDLSALLKTTGVLRSKFGRLHIQFGQALSIKTYAEKNGLPLDTSNPNAWNEKVPRLGFEILRRIADVCTVTPTAVVSSVLLSHQGRGIGLSKLVELGTELIEFLEGATSAFSETLYAPHNRAPALIEAVEKIADDTKLEVQRPGRRDVEPIYRVPEQSRLLLDFPKNQIINYLAPSAVIARSLLRVHQETGELDISIDQIRKDSRFLSRLFKHEFIYRADASFDVVFDETAATLAVRGYFELNDSKMTINSIEKLALLAGFLDPFIEAYWCTVDSLAELESFPLWDKELLNRGLELARRRYLEGKISRPEAANQTVVKAALNWLQGEGWLKSATIDKKKNLQLTEFATADERSKFSTKLSAFLVTPSTD